MFELRTQLPPTQVSSQGSGQSTGFEVELKPGFKCRFNSLTVMRPRGSLFIFLSFGSLVCTAGMGLSSLWSVGGFNDGEEGNPQGCVSPDAITCQGRDCALLVRDCPHRPILHVAYNVLKWPEKERREGNAQTSSPC